VLVLACSPQRYVVVRLAPESVRLADDHGERGQYGAKLTPAFCARFCGRVAPAGAKILGCRLLGDSGLASFDYDLECEFD